jgi:hypothetical protein
METRRKFLKKLMAAGAALALGPNAGSRAALPRRNSIGVATLYRALNGSPSENMLQVLDLMGGIEKLVGYEDVVLLKPNVQWWNQGAANLSAVGTFVDLIMERPGGFAGEVVMAENCHRGPKPWNSTNSGWAHPFQINADLPGIHHYNDLSAHLKGRYGNRFSTCHWVNRDVGSRRVYGPDEGPGYVYCDGTGGVPLLSCHNGAQGEDHRKVIMSYPIFETDQGTLVDFRHGIWEKGSYTGRPFRFINFAALNHHSAYCGATSAVKNYMGITDLSGGPDPHAGGRLTGEYYNFHSFPFNKWSPGPVPGLIGAEVGLFMKTIRRADLNITTAEWVGLSSRTEHPVARTRAVLASEDPVALDYHGSKYLLYPNSKLSIHDPDRKTGPLYQYLSRCAESGGGILDERMVSVRSFNIQKRRLEQDHELAVTGDRHWGTNPRSFLIYLVLRYG